MTKHILAEWDTRDDRREFVTLLARLPPPIRLKWLLGCCMRARSHQGQPVTLRPKPEMYEMAEKARWCDNADARLTQECFQDVIFMSCQYKFDLDAALERLVQIAKKHGRQLVWRARR